jgi:hypothetical protein
MPVNPIDRPEFDRGLYREPNPDVMRELRGRTEAWKTSARVASGMRQRLDEWVVLAYDAGHSYAQLREQTGFGNGTLEMILAKAGRLKRR